MASSSSSTYSYPSGFHRRTTPPPHSSPPHPYLAGRGSVPASHSAGREGMAPQRWSHRIYPAPLQSDRGFAHTRNTAHTEGLMQWRPPQCHLSSLAASPLWSAAASLHPPSVASPP